MGILEIHFHDSEFSWSVNPGTGKERSLSLGTGSKSGDESKSKLGSKLRSKSSSAKESSSKRGRPATGSKLGPLAVLGLVVGAGIALNRLRSRRRRGRESAKSENTSPGRRLSLFRGK